MRDTDFHVISWIIVLAIGLPSLAIVIYKGRRHVQTAFLWRAVLCVIVACIFTPWILVEDIGGVVTVDVFPVVMGLLGAIKGVFMRERGALAAAGYALLPILFVSLLLILLCEAVISVKKRNKDKES